MHDFTYIPYDKTLVSRARELRQHATESEKLFWKELTGNKDLSEYKFTRQKPLDHFIVDFYCASRRIAIELDGEIHDHQKERDAERDQILLQKFGIQVIRYSNQEIAQNIQRMAADLLQRLS